MCSVHVFSDIYIYIYIYIYMLYIYIYMLYIYIYIYVCMYVHRYLQPLEAPLRSDSRLVLYENGFTMQLPSRI